METKNEGAAPPRFPRSEEEARPIFGLTRALPGVLGAEAMQEMGSRHPKVRFQGNEYLLIGDLASGGPIATHEQYTTGECSFAHLFPDGRILRFGVKIGEREDLVLCEGTAPKAPSAASASLAGHEQDKEEK